MRKKLIASALSTVVVTLPLSALADFANTETAAAYDARMQQRLQETWAMMEKGKTDDVALTNALRHLAGIWMTLGGENGGGARGGYLAIKNGLEEAYTKTGISQERVITSLEKMVRRKLAVLGKEDVSVALFELDELLPLFGAFPDYDVLPIFKECLQSESEYFRVCAMETYAHIKGAKAIPLIRESMKERRLSDKNRKALDNRLESLVRDFRSENKTDEATKFTAFRNEMKQAEKETP